MTHRSALNQLFYKARTYNESRRKRALGITEKVAGGLSARTTPLVRRTLRLLAFRFQRPSEEAVRNLLDRSS